MKPSFYSSKEEIRNRILKNAEDFWNLKNANDFDPLVKLIVEILGNELFNVSNDVKNLENRIFDKISRILAPDHLISALPAHAIMHAKPLERADVITPYLQFYHQKTVIDEEDKSKKKKLDVFFSSLQKVKIQQAGVAYLATGDNIQFFEGLSKQPLFNALPGYSLEKNTIYIGIKGLANWMDLNKMNFFFDWKNYAVPENTYELLALGHWFLDNNPIPSFIERFMDEPVSGKEQPPFHNKQLLNLVKADIKQYYATRFITLGELNDVAITQETQLPQEFAMVFQPADLRQIDKDVTWLKLVLPAAITQEMLNELHIYINAFPVVNKRLIEIKHRLKTMSNVVPIKTELQEQMLSVEQVNDSWGNTYIEIPYTNEYEKGDGSYAIRYGGTERFDTRNAKELIDYLFELLRDEKAAFSAYGPDFLSTILKSLEQNIALIEQKSSTAVQSIKELPSYIVIKPIDDADIAFLDIWVTQANDANHINTGSRLVVHEQNRVKPESVYFLTTTKGGRHRLSATNRVQAYKYGLTTADKIITKADIINFCHYELGDKIIRVSLSKGLMMSVNPNAGFTKTTDIVVEPSTKANMTKTEWNELLDLTLSKLKLRSTMNINYRMLLKTEVTKMI